MLCAGWSIYENLSTKTPYLAQQDASTYTAPPAGCGPVHMEYLARHGSREPTTGNINQMQALSVTLHANAERIRNPDYAWMKTWVSPYQKATAGLLLIPSGADEHYLTSKRMLQNYPEVLLANNYTPIDYSFQSTQISRTGQSGSAFIYGVFEGRGDLGPANFMPYYIFANSTSTDLQLRFFDNCPTYGAEVLNNPATDEQAQQFASQTWQALALQISESIGAYPEWQIDETTMSSMWTACTFEIVISNDTSQFCTLFNETNIDAINYALDLHYYYVSGPGNALNYQPATLLLSDMWLGLDCYVRCPSLSSPLCPSYCKGVAATAKLRFAHAETTMPFVSLLGLFHDATPLMADWTPQQIANRKWDTSVISPFAANDNFVLYSCPNDAYYVKYLHNEKEYILPGCPDVYCPYQQFNASLQAALSLDYNTICNYTACPTAAPPLEQPGDHACNVKIAIIAGSLSLLCALLIVLILVLNYSKIFKQCGCGKTHGSYQRLEFD
ncbi:MAG: histidine-type phosphatase [archaeon]|nr:histidine-type phosphatase [archaeon]